MAHDHKADARAAFLGLIIGAIVLLGLVYGIVRLTDASYSAHSQQTKTH
jgi:hypothetical protein